MIFAQIENGMIQNTIIVKDESSLDLFQNDPISGNPYDFIIRVDTMYPQPGIGWSFDGIMFTSPVQTVTDDGD